MGAIAGLRLLWICSAMVGAMARCHCWVPLLGAMLFGHIVLHGSLPLSLTLHWFRKSAVLS